MFSKIGLYLTVTLPMLGFVVQLSAKGVPMTEVMPEHVEVLSSGPRLLLDTKIEADAANDGVIALPEMAAGDTIKFQLFAPDLAGQRMLGLTIELALRDKAFNSHIGNMSYTGIFSLQLKVGDSVVHVGSLPSVTVPASGYLAQIDMEVIGELTSSDALTVLSAQVGPANGNAVNLDVSEAVLTFGQQKQLRLDTRIESPPQNNNAVELPEKRAGDTLQFQLFVPDAGGRQIQAYTVELALKGKTFDSYIEDVSGMDLTGAALISGASGSGNPTLSMLSLSVLTVPTSGYLGQVTLRVSRALTSSDALEVASAEVGSTDGVENLDVSQALVTFTAPPPCPGDFDGNGMVNLSDFLVFAGAFGTRTGDPNHDARADMDGSGAIDLSDFLVFAGVFGTTCEAPPPRVVSIPDANLRALIEDKLGKASGAAITAAEMETLTRLDAPNSGIRDLTGLEHAANLTRLDLGDKYVAGEGYVNSNGISDLSPLSGLTNLTWLDLVRNSISDVSALFSLGSLERLLLSGNQLSGLIPVELGSLSGLRLLFLNENQLSGSIPVELGNLSNLERLSLSGNQLSGSIPVALSRLSSVNGLYLHSNQLSGSIPVALGRLSSLRGLTLHSNQLSGSIPVALGRLSSLSGLYLHSNQLSGTVPVELGNLSNLERLSLSGNQLSGSIPEELGNLSNLERLWLHSNQLSGAIPRELGNLSKLEVLYLYDNLLNGSIPVELGNLSKLTHLSLRSNQLSGTIPVELGNLSNLEELYLYDNLLNGSIPVELGNLSKLNRLLLNDNADLAGPMPGSFTRLDSLSYLYLDGTGLCAPTDAAFQTWLQGIENKRGVTDCASGTGGGASGTGKIYWIAETGDLWGKIQRANLDGTQVEDIVTGLFLPSGLDLDLDAEKIYWAAGTNRGKIQRANLDGTQVEDVVTGIEHPEGMVLHVDAGKIYWAAGQLGDKIQWANLDGTGVQDLVTGLNGLSELALDVGASKIYWTTTIKIQRANLDGTQVQDVVARIRYPGGGLALHVGAGKIYWTNDEDGTIQRANLDGTGVEDIVTGLLLPSGLSLDLGADKVYWANSARGIIQSANLDGTDVQAVVSRLDRPTRVVLDNRDRRTRKIYWSDSETGKIRRSNLDGTNVQDLITGLDGPGGLALDLNAGKIYWAGEAPNPINRANLDGTRVEEGLGFTSSHRAEDVALDLGSGKIYVTGLGGINYWNIDGRDFGTVVRVLSPSGTELGRPGGLALDLNAGKIYWAGEAPNPINRANLDGTRVEEGLGFTSSHRAEDVALDLDSGKIYVTGLGGITYWKIDGRDFARAVTVLSPSGTELGRPGSLAVDLDAGKIYWTYPEAGKIQRANLDGTGIQDLVIGLARPAGLALDLGN